MHRVPSWLNMVEIEIGVMVEQCLDRRIPDKTKLIVEIARWEEGRNSERAKIKWLFTVERARVKLGRSYPTPAKVACKRPATTQTFKTSVARY